MLYLPHIPLAFRKLTDTAVGGINHIQVPPVITFRYPQYVTAVIHPVAIEVIVIYERGGFFLGQNAGCAIGPYGNELVELVPAPVVLEGEEPGVRRPSAQSEVILVLPRGCVEGYLHEARYVKEGRDSLWKRVSRLVIVKPTVCGLYLVIWAGIAQQDLALFVFLPSERRYVSGVR